LLRQDLAIPMRWMSGANESARASALASDLTPAADTALASDALKELVCRRLRLTAAAAGAPVNVTHQVSLRFKSAPAPEKCRLA
jgi:hypothetical protein